MFEYLKLPINVVPSSILLHKLYSISQHFVLKISAFTQETSQLLRKYKNQSRFTSIIGGAGVTAGEKQLTSGSGVGIYQGFTQETSQLLKKYKNYSHLTRLASALQPNIRFLWSISASCDPSYNTLATKIYHYP